jgi:hypothetical protein
MKRIASSLSLIFHKIQLFALLLVGCVSISGMDVDTIFSMYDAYDGMYDAYDATPFYSSSDSDGDTSFERDSSLDTSVSSSHGYDCDQSRDESDHADDSSREFDANKKYSVLVHRSIPNVANNEMKKKRLVFLDEDENEISGREFINANPKHQDLVKQVRSMYYNGIEGRDSKNKKINRLKPLQNKERFEYSDFIFGGALNPEADNIEVYTHVNVAKRNDFEEALVAADVNRMLESLESNYSENNYKIGGTSFDFINE